MNGKAAVFMAIGLILGLLAGLAIGANLDGETAPPRVADVDFGASDNAPVAKDQPLEKRPAREETPRREPPPTSLKSLLESVDIPPIPSGNGEITGVVRTTDGKPLPGVQVTAASTYPDDMGYDLETAEERIAARMRFEKWREQERVTVTTDDEGKYGLTGLDETIDYSVTAKLAGWQIEGTDGRRRRAKPGETFDFVARVSMTLQVTVRMPNGSLATGGRVSGNQRGSGASTQIKGGRGELNLREGPWTIYAEAGSDDELKSEILTIEVVEGQLLEPIELVLKSRPGIKGRIVRPENFSEMRARVYLQSNPPADPPPERFENRREGYRSDYGNQSFKFFDLEPGSYRLLLVSDDKVVDWQDVAVTDSLIEADLTLPAPDKAEYIIVRVYDPEGELLTNVEFRLTVRAGNGSSSGGGEMKHPDGSYWLPRNRSERSSEEGAWFIVQAEHDRYGAKSVRYEVADTHELDIRFTEPARVTLTVSNFNDHPLRDKLDWRLVREGDDDMPSSLRAFRGADNKSSRVSPFSLGPVEPGEYRLTLHVSDEHFNSRDVYSQRVTLVEGENTLTALVPALYTLTILTSDGNSSRLEVVGKDSEFRYRGYRSRGGDDKKLVVEGIPPGTYTVQANDGGMEVIVSGDTEIEFKPRPYDCLVVTVKPGSHAETVGLRTGDKLVAVDEEEFEDIKLASNIMVASMAKDSTTWTVIRAGVRTDITFDGKAMMKHMETDRGLNFKPGFQTE